MLSDGDFYIWCDTWSGNFGGGDSTGVSSGGFFYTHVGFVNLVFCGGSWKYGKIWFFE